MSIPQDIVLAQVQLGRLRPLVPFSRRARLLRTLLVTDAIWDVLHGYRFDQIDENRLGTLRADLELFVTSEEIAPHYLFWLTPKDDLVWEIRSVADDPSLRILGHFAGQNIFVALSLEERPELGGWNSESWKRAIRTTKQRWGSIFPSYPTHSGVEPDEFFTGALSERYFKK